MNTKAILTCLTLIVIIAVSACGGAATPAPTQAPVTKPPATGVLFDGGRDVPLESKPLLAFSATLDLPEFPPQMEVDQFAPQSVAFTLPEESRIQGSPPNALISITVAPFTTIKPRPKPDLTAVSVVELGPNSSSSKIEPGIYEVLIDLNSTDPSVSGQLSPITATTSYLVNFQRIPQMLNPERTASPYDEFKGLNPPPDSGASISADSVCFLVKTGGDPDYIRYCSEPGSVLSPGLNLGPQYEKLKDTISSVAARFQLQNAIQLDQTISMMESGGHIQACSQFIIKARAAPPAEENVCNSDVVVAPVTIDHFNEAYKEAKNQATEGRFSVPVAVLHVFQKIVISKGVLQPGDYHMDYWFEFVGENVQFFAATVSGFEVPGQGQGQEREVINQQIPAVPAALINADGTDQPGAQISACKILGKCTLFQQVCP